MDINVVGDGLEEVEEIDEEDDACLASFDSPDLFGGTVTCLDAGGGIVVMLLLRCKPPGFVDADDDDCKTMGIVCAVGFGSGLGLTRRTIGFGGTELVTTGLTLLTAGGAGAEVAADCVPVVDGTAPVDGANDDCEAAVETLGVWPVVPG